MNDWTENAACRGMPPRMWYPERGESARHAIDVCRTCPVRSECYTDALVRHENDGIWGGVSFNRKSRRDARLAAS